ncbi:MAG: hypothetical protein WCQ94_05635 [Lachnospiraceae bacterium]|nr:hypothetical protein [Lachnospiraceae bacterium]MDD4524878.1 hypothetical protein [Lachnospiraceae bacterium]
MKKSVQIIYICIFVVFLAAPVLFFKLGGSKLVDSSNSENRTLSEMPSLEMSRESIEGFADSFESFFNDHLPFRNQLVTLGGLADYDVFHDTNSDSVIIGKKGWLFYKGSQINGEDPVADYEGTNLFTVDELEQIAANMTQMKADLEANGVKKFVIMICPNKERVYSEYMPDSYGELTEYGRMEQVVDYLEQNTDIAIVCPYDTIMTYKEEHPDEQLYFKYDTHWNNEGAFLGAYDLYKALYVEDMPSLDQLGKEDGSVPTYDLARLIHLGNVLNNDPAPILKGYTLHSVDETRNDDNTVFSFNNPNKDGIDSNLMIIGDSFSSLMSPFLGYNYNHLYTTFYYRYSYADLEREQPDTVVYEVVERYINNMSKFSVEDGLSMYD